MLISTFALVEYRDGTMGMVDPMRIRFVNELKIEIDNRAFSRAITPVKEGNT